MFMHNTHFNIEHIKKLPNVPIPDKNTVRIDPEQRNHLLLWFITNSGYFQYVSATAHAHNKMIFDDRISFAAI